MGVTGVIFAKSTMMSCFALRVNGGKLVSKIIFNNFSVGSRARRTESRLNDKQRSKKKKNYDRMMKQFGTVDSNYDAHDITDNKMESDAPPITKIAENPSVNSRLLKKKKNVNKSITKGGDVKRINPVEDVTESHRNSSSSEEDFNQSQTRRTVMMELMNKYSDESAAPFAIPKAKITETVISSRPKKLTFSAKKKLAGESEEGEVDRPFTLPSGKFKPKQSLGQNFLSDQNYVLKICDAFVDKSLKGNNVVEIGPGPGALTRVLYPRYPNMTAIEIDPRAVEFLGGKLPGLNIQHLDVLKTDWPQLAADKGGCLNIVANLPYYIVSQVLFSLADSHRAVDTAVLTMQLEVAQRIVAKPSTKDYGIPSVVFQLYGSPRINFLIPPTVFYPKPKVDSALLTIDFRKPNPDLYRVNGDNLRRILAASFQQRRKMLRQSLKALLLRDGLSLGDKWATRRPEELSPSEFVQMTVDLYGEEPQPQRTLPAVPEPVQTPPKAKKVKAVIPPQPVGSLRRKKKIDEVAVAAAAQAAALEASLLAAEELAAIEAAKRAAIAAKEAQAQHEIARKMRSTYVTRPVWRMALFGASGTRGFGMTAEEEVVEKERLEAKRLKKEKRRMDIMADELFFRGDHDEGQDE